MCECHIKFFAVKCFATDRFELPLPPGHRFPIEKYRLLRENLQAQPDLHIAEAEAASWLELLRVHTRAYLDKVRSGSFTPHELRRLGLPWSPQLVERSRRSVGATVAACTCALQDGCAANLAGGTHHAFSDRGEGFCVFNDVAVALTGMLDAGRIGTALVIDLDVHQGNGTAAIFRNDPRVFTLSLHGRNNFPFHKEQSDLDVELEDGCGDCDYLNLLDDALARLDARAFDFVVYLAGADAYQGDRLGKLALTQEGLLERDARVAQFCSRRRLPVALTMAGGYARHIPDTAAIQANTVRLFAREARTASKPAP